MTLSELEELFSKLEKNPKVFEPKICNVPIWVLIKQYLVTYVNDLESNLRPLSFMRRVYKDRISLLRMLREFFLGFLEWHRISRKFKKKCFKPIIMVLSYGVYKTPLKDGRYKNFFFDDIYLNRHRDFDMFVIETTEGFQRLTRTVGPRHLRAEYLTTPGYLGARFFRLPPQIKKEINRLSEIIVSNISSFPSVRDAVRKYFDDNVADRLLFRFLMLSKRSVPIIDIIQPKAILVIGSPYYYGLIFTAKKRDIPVIEIQHGVCSKWIPFGWPKKYKSLKPNWPIPDKIIVWGRSWAEQQTAGGFWNEEDVLPLGNCRIDDFRLRSLKYEINSVANRNDGKVKLLFTTGGRVQRSKIISFLSELLKQAKSNSIPVILYIKVHPWEENEMKDYLLLKNNYIDHCVVFHPKEASLYNLISKVDIHLSCWSATIYESIGLSKPTVVLDIFGNSNYFPDLLNSDGIRLCKSPGDLIQYVDEMIQNTVWWKQWVEDTVTSQKFLFAENSIESYVSYLNQI